MFAGFLLVNAGLIAAGGVATLIGFKSYGWYTKLRNVATSKIQSLAAGEVEIKGTVAPNPKNPLISPVNKAKCVAYELRAYRWERRGKNSSWKLIYAKSVARPFYLTDETGYILVEPQGARVRNDTFASERSSEPLEEIRQEMHAKADEAGAPDFFKKILDVATRSSYKFEEVIIPEGEHVYIFGYTLENPQAPDNPKVQRLKIANKPGKLFLITDESEADAQRGYLLNAATFILIGLFLILFGILEILNIIDWIGFMGGFS